MKYFIAHISWLGPVNDSPYIMLPYEEMEFDLFVNEILDALGAPYKVYPAVFKALYSGQQVVITNKCFKIEKDATVSHSEAI